MFRLFNKILRRNFRASGNSSKTSSRGQVAIILILVAAIGIILYAVSLNLAKMSQIKTQITVASNTSASLMASEMASYTESLFQTSLGGNMRRCVWTGVMAVLIAIVAIVIAIVSYGTLTWLSIAALALVAVALVLQVAIIQPGLTDLWNKMMEELAPPDQFVERGVQAALQGTVSDSKLVPDVFDFDADGFFVGNSTDEINRFGYYYTQRLRSLDPARMQVVEDFLDALEKFVFGYSKYDENFDPDTTPRDWSLWDPICDVWTEHPCCQDHSNPSVTIPSECNPCCLPVTVPPDVFSGFPPDFPVRPECCDSPGEDYCGTASTCGDESPYAEDYPFVYFPYYEDISNNCIEMTHVDEETGAVRGCHTRPPMEQWHKHISFKEVIGRDDEHPRFHTGEDHDFEGGSGWPLAQVEGGGGFRLGDTRTFGIAYENHLDEAFVTKGSLYDFLWAMGDIKADLSDVDIHQQDWGSEEFKNTRGQCFWCDSRATRLSGGDACDPDPACQRPIIGENPCCACNEDLAGLELPIDCEDSGWPADGPPCTWCVDASSDNISTLTIGEELFFTPDDECSEGGQSGVWKKGADRFCNDEVPPQWPYYASCAKHGHCIEYDEDGNLIRRECECGEQGIINAGPPEEWPDDPIDGMVYGLNTFIDWAVELLELDRDVAVRNFVAWVEDAKSWFKRHPAIPSENGELIIWRDLTNTIRFSIDRWLEREYERGATCEQMDNGYSWCIPPADCRGVSQGEQEYWQVEGDAVTLDNVLLCHYWNAYERGGNANKFTMCGTPYDPAVNPDDYPEGDAPLCSAYWCKDLPRSLIDDGTGDEFYRYVYECESTPGNPNVWNAQTQNCFKSPDMELVDAYQTCIQSIENGTCSETTCGNLPDPPAGSGVNIPPFSTGVSSAYTRCRGSCTQAKCAPNALPGFDYGAHPFSPIPGPDYEILKDCADNCQSLIGPCGNALTYPTYNGIPQDCSPNGAYMQAIRDDRDAQAGACEGGYRTDPPPLSSFLQAVQDEIDEGGADSCSDPDFRQAVEDAQCAALGSCCDDTWIDLMQRSALLAQNQTAKFQHRYDYLLEQKGRAERITNRLRDGSQHFTAFLNGPAKDLMDIADLPVTDEDEPLSNEVIYGWQSDPPEGRDEGYWHLVRVDSYAPGRCDGKCGQAGAIEPRFPTIKSYTTGLLSTKRCYVLGDSFGQPGCMRKSDYKHSSRCFKGGTVKNRVVRYDEDKEVRRFPTGLDIWQFIFHHPSKASADPSGLSACEGLGGGPGGGPGGPAGAFMLNGPQSNATCWALANSLLETGITSQTCAEYFLHGVGNRGFNLKFVTCRQRDFQ